MSIYFSDDTLSLIKDRLSVSDIIRRYVTLKQKGKDFLGLCPFHQEKTPSFTVNDQKGFYHCFGCGAHGDIFRFLTDYEKLTFQEAVEQCAAHVGIKLAALTPQQQKFQEETSILLKLLSDVAAGFHNSLKSTSGQLYYNYLTSRGIHHTTIDTFQLGVAKKGQMIQFLEAHNISKATAEKAGLVARYDNRIKEKFVDRLMFPILDEKKRVIGFGGRTLDPTIQPKYLNSSENNLFHKGSLLYGMHLIDHKYSSAILVEGYLDVIAMVQAGFKNVLAPMGTAVTLEQTKKLLKYFTKIYICFDGDPAGFKAMHRTAEVFLPLLQPGTEILFVQLPENQDPHSIITSGNQSTLDQRISQPLSLIEFLMAYEAQLHPGHQPAILALRRKHILEQITNIQDHFLKSLYKDEIYKLFQHSRTLTKQLPQTEKLPKSVSVQDIYETVLIKALIICPNLYKDFLEQLHMYSLSTLTQEILNVIETHLFSGDNLEFISIVPYIKEHMPTLNIDYILGDTFHVHAPFLNEPINEDNVRKGIERILSYFDNNASLETHIKEAQERFKQTQSQADWDRLRRLMAQKQNRHND